MKFELPKSLILRAFPADESTKAVFHFESAYFAYGKACYDRFDISPYMVGAAAISRGATVVYHTSARIASVFAKKNLRGEKSRRNGAGKVPFALTNPANFATINKAQANTQIFRGRGLVHGYSYCFVRRCG